LVALVTVLALTLVRPVLLAFAFGGIVLLIPTFVVRDPRAYWLFLLVLSIPFEISKRATTWLVEPWVLEEEFGQSGSGTLSLDFYLTDVVLLAMVLPWLVRLCLRRDSFYFPKVGYIFLLYLAWALIISLITAVSFYLSIFQWCREILYFLSFLYIINNVITRSQFRAVVLALLVGLVIESAAVITLFHLGIGTERFVFSGVYRETEHRSKTVQHTLYEAVEGTASQTKRSAGTFAHPAIAAYYLEYILWIVLAYLVTASRARDRLLLGAVFAAGCVAFYLTFSRSGLLGLICGSIVFFAAARWSRLVSRRAFAWCVLVFAIFAALGAPLWIGSLLSRPETFSYRIGLLEKGLDIFLQRPISGAGLNNSSAMMEDARTTVRAGQEVQERVIHNHYLIVLIDVGIVGFILFFTFFWQNVMTAFRSMRAAEAEMKEMLVGIVGALATVAIHNFGDPFGGHATHAMLWLFAGLIIVIGRQVQAERTRPGTAAVTA
jgi:O-antigen ligase